MARTKRKINPVQQAAPVKMYEQRIYRVGGYARLSMEDGGKPGADTIENQKDLIREYVERQSDMDLTDIYCDNGQTGTNFARPEFERLMLDVKNGRVDCIVVKDLSRFGRNYLETGNYLERLFPFLGVRFIAVVDNFDTLTAERTDAGYIVPLKNIMNESYSRDISRKVSSAYEVKRKKGEFTGTWAAYGYVKCADDPHRIMPDAETAKVVQDIFRWRLSGMGYARIARKLNREGIPSPCRYHYLKGDAKCERYASSEWNTRTLKRILTNEVYIGHLVQGRKRQSFYEGRGQRELQKSEWTIVKNTHEAIVEEEVFRAVQEMDEERIKEYRRKLGKRPKTPNILEGLVYCADCGKTMMREKHGNGTKVWYSYICRTNRGDPALCSSNSMPESKLLEILWDIVRVQLSLAEDLAGKLRDYYLRAGCIRFEDSLKQEYNAAVKTVNRAQMLYDGLYPMYAEEKLLSEREYMRMRERYLEEIAQAKKAVENVEKKRKAYRADRGENRWLKTYMEFQEEKFLTTEMTHALIKRVEIGRERNVSIELHYQDEYRRLMKILGAEEVSA